MTSFRGSAATLASKSETAAGWTVAAASKPCSAATGRPRPNISISTRAAQNVFNADFIETAHFDNHFHIYRYGVNYKFGGPAMAAGRRRPTSGRDFYAGAERSARGCHRTCSTVLATQQPQPQSFSDIADVRFTGGIQAGYNWRFSPNWVVGLEGDIGYLGSKRPYIFANDGAPTSSGVRTDWYGTMRGRLGYNTGPALLYATGGAAFVHVKNNIDDTFAPRFASESETASGWTVGGGIQAALAQNWTAKTEYLYIDAEARTCSIRTSWALGPQPPTSTIASTSFGWA